MQNSKMKKDVAVDLGNGLFLSLALIKPGKFMMGSSESEIGCFDNEHPQHQVILTNSFYLGKVPITQKQFVHIMGKNPSLKKDPEFPVTHVSWLDCQDFIHKLNSSTAGGFRLPTEAEWEYACRAGTTTPYSFGEVLTPKEANYVSKGSKNINFVGEVVRVGCYPPNRFGLHDMHGNVNEFCSDWYGPYPWGTVTDPKGPEFGEFRVVRGGTYTVFELGCRSAIRFKFKPDKHHFDIGFRVVMDPNNSKNKIS